MQSLAAAYMEGMEKAFKSKAEALKKAMEKNGE